MLCSDVLLFAFLVLLDFLDGLGTNGPLSCSSIVAFNQVSWSSWYYLHKFCWTFKSEFMFREKVTSNFLFLSIMTVKLMFYMRIHLGSICGKLWIWLNDLNVDWEVRFDCYNYLSSLTVRRNNQRVIVIVSDTIEKTKVLIKEIWLKLMAIKTCLIW